MEDAYSILNVYSDCTLNEAREAYKSAALKHHPDRHPDYRKAEAERRFKVYANAYLQICHDLGEDPGDLSPPKPITGLCDTPGALALRSAAAVERSRPLGRAATAPSGLEAPRRPPAAVAAAPPVPAIEPQYDEEEYEEEEYEEEEEEEEYEEEPEEEYYEEPAPPKPAPKPRANTVARAYPPLGELRPLRPRNSTKRVPSQRGNLPLRDPGILTPVPTIDLLLRLLEE